MTIATLTMDENGDFVRDVFYMVGWDHTSIYGDWEDLLPESDGLIVSPPPDSVTYRVRLISADRFGNEEKEMSRCPKSDNHTNYHLLVGGSVDLDGDVLGDVVPHSDEFLVLTDRAVRLIGASSLTGARFVPLSVERNATRMPLDMLQLKAVQFGGNFPLRRYVVKPPSMNHCYRCRTGPVCCPGCGWRMWDCSTCGADLLVAQSEHEGAHDPRISITPYPSEGAIVDVGLWDGSDFCGKCSFPILTRRAVEYLLSKRIGPFWAQPLRADVAGLAKEKLRLLDRAKRPIG